MADDNKSRMLSISKLLASLPTPRHKIIATSGIHSALEKKLYHEALRRLKEEGANVSSLPTDEYPPLPSILNETIDVPKIWYKGFEKWREAPVELDVGELLSQTKKQLVEVGEETERLHATIDEIVDQSSRPKTVNQAETAQGEPPWFEYPFRLIVKDDELDTAVEDFLTRYEADLDSYGPKWARVYQVWDALLFIGRGIYKVTPIARLVDSKIKHLSGDQ